LESLEGLRDINFRRDRVVGRLVVRRWVRRIRGVGGSSILTHINRSAHLVAREDQSKGTEKEMKMDGMGHGNYGRV